MLIFNLFIYLTTLRAVTARNKVTYLSTEHPEVTWFNPKFVRFVNLTSQRYSRTDPFYYVGFHVDLIWPVHYNINIDFYFYEYLSNQYKLSFVELHFEACDLISKNRFFGVPLRQFFPHSCPYDAGIYHIVNITVPLKSIPPNFPFKKGRIQANFSSGDTKELLGFGHVDMELKELNTRRVKN